MQVLRLINSVWRLGVSPFHSTASNLAWGANRNDPKHFLNYNKKIYPPQEPHEEPRPAYVCHQTTNIKYSPDKMWYIASFIRGMTVDEALKQLSFVKKTGAYYVIKTIKEAQEMAIKEQNVEFKSNLWVAESFTNKGTVIKGIRRHAKSRMGEVRYIYCHYFVRLEEGQPPEDYYKRNPKTPDQQLDDWLAQMRMRRIAESL